MSDARELEDLLEDILSQPSSPATLERFGRWWQGAPATAVGYDARSAEDQIRYVRKLQGVIEGDGLLLMGAHECYVDEEYWVFMDDGEAIYSWGLKLAEMQDPDPAVYCHDLDFHWSPQGSGLATFLLQVLCLNWLEAAPHRGLAELDATDERCIGELQHVLGQFSIPELAEWNFLVGGDALFTRSGKYLTGGAPSREVLEATGLPQCVRGWVWDE